MRKRDTVEALRREEALILAWIGEVTVEKQARLREIRRRMRRIAQAEREKRGNAVLAQRAESKPLVPQTAE